MPQKIAFKLSELAAEFAATLPDCQFISDGDDPDITGVAMLSEAQSGEITFVSTPKFLSHLPQTQASAVILDWETATPLPCIRTSHPQLLLAKVLEKFDKSPTIPIGLHPTVVLGEDVQIGENVTIAPYVVISDRVKIGDNVTIHSRVTIYNNVEIGANTTVHASCVIGDHTQIGKNCTLYPNTIVGGDGFGFDLAPDGVWYKIPQIGRVIIEDDVEVGCSSAVDRAAVGVTIVRKGTKVDNLVQIGHGVQIGEYSKIGSQGGLAGGADLGDRVVMGDRVGAAYHIHIGDDVNIASNSGIPSDVPAGMIGVGRPIYPPEAWQHLMSAKEQLPELLHTVRKLEKRLAQLESEFGELH